MILYCAVKYFLIDFGHGHTIDMHNVNPPLINASCVWASEQDQLQDLYASPFTGAVTTRTATLDGFDENVSHTVSDLLNSNATS
jgi:hypothetical protein